MIISLLLRKVSLLLRWVCDKQYYVRRLTSAIRREPMLSFLAGVSSMLRN